MIKVENLRKTYDRRTKQAHEVLHGMSFTLPDKGFVCILGASGCGKTSLLNAIGGLDAFDSGKIITDSATITHSGSRAFERERNANFGYIFQNYYLLSEHSVAYNVFLGMHSMAISKKEKMLRVKDALEKVDMLRYRKRAVGQLSGGQQQRVAIARAIARNPKVIFADEPTGNLDEANTMNICGILKEISHDSLILMVTHEERIARFFADRIITLDDGVIVSDSTDWSRETMVAGEKDALYSEDYDESKYQYGELDLRVLRAEGSDPVSLTVIAEKDRIVIKVNDPRVVLCSEMNASPKLIEGSRPVLDFANFGDSKSGFVSNLEPVTNGKKKLRATGLGFKFLFAEAKTLVSRKKLGRVGMGIFLILLSLMLSMTIADIITVAHIDPEDFIQTDSHIIDITFKRGKDLPSNIWDIDEYTSEFVNHLNDSGLDFDYVVKINKVFKYSDNTVPQLKELSVSIYGYHYVDYSRLDASTIICGRMPEHFDEIVIDRWMLDKSLEKDGVIQNVIPNYEYLVGKKMQLDKETYTATIVGVCDSGQPNIYISKSGLLSMGSGGMEVVSFSDFCEMTGYDKISSFGYNDCIPLTDIAGTIFNQYIGREYGFNSSRIFNIVDAVSGTRETVPARYVVSDDRIDDLYSEMVSYYGSFGLWCSDKEAMMSYINQGLPENIEGMIEVVAEDKYTATFNQYYEESLAKINARMIVTSAVIMLAIIMLYFMQRSKIGERMDLIAVYRLLGIPKKNLVFIFAVESFIQTIKYAVPTVSLVWLVIYILNLFEELNFDMIFPLWAAGLTLASILVVRLIIAVIPVLRLLSKAPARLAAKYDF